MTAPELLTEADLAPLRGWCREPEASIADLRIVVERIVRARIADAWDEGYDAGWRDCDREAAAHDGEQPNPYRDEEPTAWPRPRRRAVVEHTCRDVCPECPFCTREAQTECTDPQCHKEADRD